MHGLRRAYGSLGSAAAALNAMSAWKPGGPVRTAADAAKAVRYAYWRAMREAPGHADYFRSAAASAPDRLPWRTSGAVVVLQAGLGTIGGRAPGAYRWLLALAKETQQTASAWQAASAAVEDVAEAAGGRERSRVQLRALRSKDSRQAALESWRAGRGERQERRQRTGGALVSLLNTLGPVLQQHAAESAQAPPEPLPGPYPDDLPPALLASEPQALPGWVVPAGVVSVAGLVALAVFLRR